MLAVCSPKYRWTFNYSGLPQLEQHLLGELIHKQHTSLASPTQSNLQAAVCSTKSTCVLSRRGCIELSQIDSWASLEKIVHLRFQRHYLRENECHLTHDCTSIAKPPLFRATSTTEVTLLVHALKCMCDRSTKQLRHPLSQSLITFCFILLMKSNLNLYSPFPVPSLPTAYPCISTIATLPAFRSSTVCPVGIILKHWETAQNSTKPSNCLQRNSYLLK